jgi:hypothetical protein
VIYRMVLFLISREIRTIQMTCRLFLPRSKQKTRISASDTVGLSWMIWTPSAFLFLWGTRRLAQADTIMPSIVMSVVARNFSCCMFEIVRGRLRPLIFARFHGAVKSNICCIIWFHVKTPKNVPYATRKDCRKVSPPSLVSTSTGEPSTMTV